VGTFRIEKPDRIFQFPGREEQKWGTRKTKTMGQENQNCPGSRNSWRASGPGTEVLEQERQEEELAATEIGRIVIDHLKNDKPFDAEFKERVRPSSLSDRSGDSNKAKSQRQTVARGGAYMA